MSYRLRVKTGPDDSETKADIFRGSRRNCVSWHFRKMRAYAAGRCARRKEWIWRTASGIRSFGSFQGNMLTSALGASIAASIATA
jgi:hypothetical protein